MRGDLGYSWLVCGQLSSENDRDPLRKHENESPTGSPPEVASPEATPGEQPDPAYQPSAYNRLIFMGNGNRGRVAGFHRSNWWPARPHGVLVSPPAESPAGDGEPDELRWKVFSGKNHIVGLPGTGCLPGQHQKNHMMPVGPQAYRIKIVGWPFLMG